MNSCSYPWGALMEIPNLSSESAWYGIPGCYTLWSLKNANNDVRNSGLLAENGGHIRTPYKIWGSTSKLRVRGNFDPEIKGRWRNSVFLLKIRGGEIQFFVSRMISSLPLQGNIYRVLMCESAVSTSEPRNSITNDFLHLFAKGNVKFTLLSCANRLCLLLLQYNSLNCFLIVTLSSGFVIPSLELRFRLWFCRAIDSFHLTFMFRFLSCDFHTFPVDFLV